MTSIKIVFFGGSSSIFNNAFPASERGKHNLSASNIKKTLYPLSLFARWIFFFISLIELINIVFFFSKNIFFRLSNYFFDRKILSQKKFRTTKSM